MAATLVQRVSSPTPSFASTSTTQRRLKTSVGWPRAKDDFENLLGEEYAQLKASIVEQYGEDALRRSWTKVCNRLNDTVVRNLVSQGARAIPQVSFEELTSSSPETTARIREAGCVVVCGLFDSELAQGWQTRVKAYVARNRGLVRGIPRGADVPAAWDVFWSAPQLEAREHPRMLRAQARLNHLWHDSDPAASADEPVDLDQPVSYADRVRLREPGDAGFALGPHVDAGSLERWQDPQYRSVYDDILGGRFDGFDDYDIRRRLTAVQDLYGGTAASSVLRTWQGWTSLSNTGPGEGSLKLYPAVREGIAYLMLRPFFAPPKDGGWENPDSWTLDTSSAFPGSTGGKSQELGAISHPHLRLRECMVSVPRVYPGDAVFWHCDVIHAVDPVHLGTETAAVFYIGAAPSCRMNNEYLQAQLEHFKLGWAPPDYRTSDEDENERYFDGFEGEAGIKTEAGRKAMGISV